MTKSKLRSRRWSRTIAWPLMISLRSCAASGSLTRGSTVSCTAGSLLWQKACARSTRLRKSAKRRFSALRPRCTRCACARENARTHRRKHRRKHRHTDAGATDGMLAMNSTPGSLGTCIYTYIHISIHTDGLTNGLTRMRVRVRAGTLVHVSGA